MIFEPTINIGNLIMIAMIGVTIIGGWYKFGGRLDMIEYRVKAVEDTLKIIATAIEKQNANEKQLALVDQRLVSAEGLIDVLSREVSDLRRGQGFITGHRAGIDGEYTR